MGGRHEGYRSGSRVDTPSAAMLSWGRPTKNISATSISYGRAMKRVHRPSLLRRAPHVSGLFAALFLGAYALLLVDLYSTDQLGRSWIVLMLGALVVLLGTLGFPAVEWRSNRGLTAVYFALQLPLGAAIFATSTLGGTFLLLVVVGQSVRVLPPSRTIR